MDNLLMNFNTHEQEAIANALDILRLGGLKAGLVKMYGSEAELAIMISLKEGRVTLRPDEKGANND